MNDKTTIGFMSDLHVEFHLKEPRWLPSLPTECDVLLLGGDIGNRKGAIEAVMRIAKALPDAQIIFICGNHEFYRSSIDNQLIKYRAAFENEERIHFLENDSVMINGITFLGCTLWTGFDILGKEYIRPSMDEALRCIADFHLMRSEAGSRPFLPMEAITRYRESRQWLSHQLKNVDPDSCVVITHFPPCREARHKNIREDLLTNYFQANCRSLIEKYQPAAWVYGHNHWSDELMIGKTRVASNQLGYPEEAGMIPEFDPQKIILL